MASGLSAHCGSDSGGTAARVGEGTVDRVGILQEGLSVGCLWDIILRSVGCRKRPET